jgi:hypothetical protein
MTKIKSILIFAAVFSVLPLFAQSNMERSVENFGSRFERTDRQSLQRIDNPNDPSTKPEGSGGVPVGEGIAVLSLLGAAYTGLKVKRKNKH